MIHFAVDPLVCVFILVVTVVVCFVLVSLIAYEHGEAVGRRSLKAETRKATRVERDDMIAVLRTAQEGAADLEHLADMLLTYPGPTFSPTQTTTIECSFCDQLAICRFVGGRTSADGHRTRDTWYGTTRYACGLHRAFYESRKAIGAIEDL